MEEHLITEIKHDRDEAQLTLFGVPDRPGTAAKIFSDIARQDIECDIIVQNSVRGGRSDFTFTVRRSDFSRVYRGLKERKAELGAQEIVGDARVAKISLSGVGMRSHPAIVFRVFSALASKGIDIQVISTMEKKISMCIKEGDVSEAKQALREEFGLDDGPGGQTA